MDPSFLSAVSLPCHLWHMSMRSKGWFTLLIIIKYLENAMVRWLEGNNNTDQSLLTSYTSFTELSLTGKSNSSRNIWIVSVHGTSSLGFSAVNNISHIISLQKYSYDVIFGLHLTSTPFNFPQKNRLSNWVKRTCISGVGSMYSHDGSTGELSLWDFFL